MDRSNLLFALFVTATVALCSAPVWFALEQKKAGIWAISIGAAFGMTALWIPVFWY